MPLINCPNCNRITYAYPILNDYNEVVAYRCSQCWNVYNYGQVHTLPFPNIEILLNTTFREIIAEIDRVDSESINEDGEELAKRFIYCIKFLARPREIRLYQKRFDPLVFYAAWDYRGTRDAEEYNDELMERAQQVFAEAIDRYYVAVEIREPDEGDSIFVAVHPDDVDTLINALNPYSLCANR